MINLYPNIYNKAMLTAICLYAMFQNWDLWDVNLLWVFRDEL